MRLGLGRSDDLDTRLRRYSITEPTRWSNKRPSRWIETSTRQTRTPREATKHRMFHVKPY